MSYQDKTMLVLDGDVMGIGQHNELALMDTWAGQPVPGLVVSVRKRNAGSGLATALSPELVARFRDALTAWLVDHGHDPETGGAR